ncbi:MAG: PEGA domain-containing protein [Lachnospiraceae bacterium]|nr:PEGA domain-containing protein [Lachnospiraceae bacterium]
MQYKRVFTVKNINRYLTAAVVICSAFLFVSCGSGNAGVPQQTVSETTADKLEFSELEAQDTAVFLEYEEKLGDVKLMSVDNGRSYTVSINNLTTFEDNYGKVSVPELFETGMIVDVDVSVHSRTLKSMQQDPDAFVRRDVTGFEINPNRGVFSLDDGTNLHITENTLVIKEDKKIKITDISENDVLLLRGIDHELYSIKIMSGYGHLRIKGAEFFTGGWVQIAGMFKPVSDDMILDVPEGEYDLIVTYKGQGGTKHVRIDRGKEATVDVSDLKGDLIKTGEIIFSIRPLSADPVVKINGEKVDHLNPVELEYGIYQLEVTAEGYAAIKERIAVGAEVANIEIELTEAESSSASENKSSPTTAAPASTSANNLPTNLAGSSSSTSVWGSGITTPGSTTSSSKTTGSSTSSSTSSASGTSSSSADEEYESSIIYGSRIYIDAPETAEVYFDGIYKGIVPCSFVKISGTHVITLRKDGYETRTFTITLDDSKENETYSFSALQEE